MWHRQNWAVVYPHMALEHEGEMEELGRHGTYVAGFLELAVQARTDLYDLFVNGEPLGVRVFLSVTSTSFFSLSPFSFSHTHTCECMHAHTHTHACTHTHTHMHACIHTHTCTHAYTRTPTHTPFLCTTVPAGSITVAPHAKGEKVMIYLCIKIRCIYSNNNMVNYSKCW